MMLLTSWHSYPKLYNMGHAALANLFNGDVTIEEKIDGSQFSFGIFDGEIKVRSKGQELDVNHPEKMFKVAVGQVIERAHLLQNGWTYRGEYLQKPKHNTLAYDRTPRGNIIIFDISPAEEQYLPYEHKAHEAERIGLEVVPQYHLPELNTDAFLDLLNNVSCLGGQKIEGFVVKNYSQFGPDKKALMGKYVSEAFKEVHKVTWKKDNPGQGDIIALLIETYKHPTRWNKAIQHLTESGKLTNSVKDIGFLIKEIGEDIKLEAEAEIKETLFKWAWANIQRGVIRGFPEWYKEKLLGEQFK